MIIPFLGKLTRQCMSLHINIRKFDHFQNNKMQFLTTGKLKNIIEHFQKKQNDYFTHYQYYTHVRFKMIMICTYI